MCFVKKNLPIDYIEFGYILFIFTEGLMYIRFIA